MAVTPTRRRPHVHRRHARRLSAAARADRAAARLFLRPAAGAVGIDAAGLDARERGRSRHHRPVCAGRHALHAEIPLGAAGRCARCAVLSRLLGRRRGWLVFSQLLLIAAIVFLALVRSGAVRAFVVALGALLVATASATQDIVVDAFRVESLPESEQAAGMASYVAAYRIGMLVSTAGALFIVSAFQGAGLDHQAAWSGAMWSWRRWC